MLKDDPQEQLLGNNNPQTSIVSEEKQSISKEPKQRKHREKKTKSELAVILKFMNFIVGLSLIGFAVYGYYYGVSQSETVKQNWILNKVMPAYVGLSGLIILMVECRIGIFVRNMRFLYNYFGRGLFNIYAGIMPLAMMPNIEDHKDWTAYQIITVVITSIMVIIGILYIIMKICCCMKQGQEIDKQNKRRKRQAQGSDSDSDGKEEWN